MTTLPTDWQWYMKNHIEVPKCCPDGSPLPGDGAPMDGVLEGETLPPTAPQTAPTQPPAGTAKKPAGRTPVMPVVNRPQTRTNPPSRQGVNVTQGRPASQPAGQRAGMVGPIGYDNVE
jgi:hypothetical protein